MFMTTVIGYQDQEQYLIAADRLFSSEHGFTHHATKLVSYENGGMFLLFGFAGLMLSIQKTMDWIAMAQTDETLAYPLNALIRAKTDLEIRTACNQIIAYLADFKMPEYAETLIVRHDCMIELTSDGLPVVYRDKGPKSIGLGGERAHGYLLGLIASGKKIDKTDLLGAVRVSGQLSGCSSEGDALEVKAEKPEPKKRSKK